VVSPIFFLKKVTTLFESSSSTLMTFLVVVTTPILSTFQLIISPVFFVDSSAKNYTFIRVPP